LRGLGPRIHEEMFLSRFVSKKKKVVDGRDKPGQSGLAGG